MGDSGGNRVFYRLIRSNVPEEWDFLSQKLQGNPLRNPDERERWARGVSVFERTQAAMNIALRIKPPMPYMVKLVIPDTCTLRIEPWGSRFHATIWDADPLELLGYVEGPAALVLPEQ
ncbi:MAG: hypothetical protein ACRDHN_02390 [Thermomicrobiales bacterium]